MSAIINWYLLRSKEDNENLKQKTAELERAYKLAQEQIDLLKRVNHQQNKVTEILCDILINFRILKVCH